MKNIGSLTDAIFCEEPGSTTLHSHSSRDLENETPALGVIALSTVAEPSAPEVEDAPRFFYRLILKPVCAFFER